MGSLYRFKDARARQDSDAWRQEVRVRHARDRRRFIAKETRRHCAWCGGAFSTASPWSLRRFCDGRCRSRYHQRIARKAKPHAVVCRTCGQSFEAVKASATYCGPACRQAAYRARRQKTAGGLQGEGRG